MKGESRMPLAHGSSEYEGDQDRRREQDVDWNQLCALACFDLDIKWGSGGVEQMLREQPAPTPKTYFG